MLKRCFVFLVAAIAVWGWVTKSSANSLRSIDNPANQYERAILTSFPTGFGSGEFTFEIWVKLDNRAAYETGLCGAGGNPRLNWCSENAQRYAYNCWWCNGNFLIDGVNFDGVTKGTFALQMYDGGRVRWLIGDDNPNAPRFDDFWSVGNSPTATNPSLLDGQWHSIAVVRRFVATSASDLELWIDGVLIDTVRSNARANLATYWEGYADGFLQGNLYSGWFFLAEKQAVNVANFVLEDYKGLIDEVRFWNRAKTASELSTQWRDSVSVGATGLSGYYDFSDATLTQTCDRVAPTKCMRLTNPNTSNTSFVSSESAPVGTTAAAGPLDIDASATTTRYDAATDALLLIRYLLGMRDAALVGGALGSTATRNAAQIQAHIAAQGLAFDVDNDGVVRAHTDGILIARYLRNLRGASLVTGTSTPASNADAIELRIQALMP
jgi:hypothetical protein